METEDSDMDILVLTDLEEDNIKKFDTEIDKISVDLSLKFDIVFSFVIVNINHYNKYLNILPFYGNIAREGTVIYGD